MKKDYNAPQAEIEHFTSQYITTVSLIEIIPENPNTEVEF